jgi:hypothetical protein
MPAILNHCPAVPGQGLGKGVFVPNHGGVQAGRERRRFRIPLLSGPGEPGVGGKGIVRNAITDLVETSPACS